VNPSSEFESIAKRNLHLVLSVAAALRTAAYYDASNAVMQQVCTGLRATIADICHEDGSARVTIHSHTIYVNDARVPASVATYLRFSLLMQQFEDWSISGLVFKAGLTENELMRALALLAATQQCASGELATALRSAAIEHIVADYTVRGTGTRSLQVTPVVAYTAAMQLGGELSQVGGSLEKGMVRRVRHVTQAVVDQILRDPSSLLALTTIKDFDRYLILHSTNVAVLSTLLGQRLGLGKARLGELCLAGFLHDAGKLGVDPDVLHKPGALDHKEWQEMRRHPVLAAYSLLGNQRLNSSSMRAVVVAFEHHMSHDFTGYPPVEIKKSISLFGRIVAIADTFDALTTARVYRKVNPTPPEAILHLMKLRGTQFDPALVKLFIEVLGVYPPGTVLALTGREAGVVCKAPAAGSPVDRPRVRLVVGAEPGRVVDLNERKNGAYVRNVVAVLNPSNKGQIPAIAPAVMTSAVESM
jgi:HD-GYP domain-containing protein (c-di-GMP phosphodiesterase class II)